MAIRCIIVDDEPLARELLRSYVEKTPGLEYAGQFASATEALKTVTGGGADLIFLDINMPNLNGIEFASLVPKESRIVYVTAYGQYALEGFRVNALDYLLKPVSYQEFLKSVVRATEWFAMRDRADRQPQGASPTGGMLTVKADCRLVQMKIENIRYVEVQKDRVVFWRADGDPVSSVMSMKEIEDQLPAETFMRVHRSYIVNLRQVEIVERGRIVFGDTQVPIADSRRDEFLSRLGR